MCLYRIKDELIRKKTTVNAKIARRAYRVVLMWFGYIDRTNANSVAKSIEC